MFFRAPFIGASMLIGLLLTGCGDELRPGSFIEQSRLIGIELRVEGEPERAIARRGETLEVALLTAAPAGVADPTGQWLLFACEAETTPIGLPTCSGDPFGFTMGALPENEAAFGIPDAIEAPATMLLIGVLCPEGAPQLPMGELTSIDPNTICTTGPGQIFQQSIEVDGAAGNLRPTWPPNALRWQGAPWAETNGCADPATPRWNYTDGTAEITLGPFGGELREVYSVMVDDELVEEREELRISHFTDVGEVSRQFTIFDEYTDEREETELVIDWERPDVAPTEEQSVRFYFVARDLRGGSELTKRSICLLPPPPLSE